MTTRPRLSPEASAIAHRRKTTRWAFYAKLGSLALAPSSSSVLE